MIKVFHQRMCERVCIEKKEKQMPGLMKRREGWVRLRSEEKDGPV